VNDWLSGIKDRLLCLFDKHEPRRDKARRVDTIYFVSTCRRCGTPIRKRHGFAWKAYTPDDQSPRQSVADDEIGRL
jgi:hypothetical protein